MLTLLIFLIVIGVLVFVHEFGHFYMAKRAGMKVEEFGFGFPPRLFGIKRGETTYSINWIPFGGFVKILGEDGDDRGPRSFGSKSISARMKVILAGVVMNVILGAVLLVIVNNFGLRIGLVENDSVLEARDIQVQIVDIAPGSPAALAELRPLDQIAAIELANGEMINITSVRDAQQIISQNVGESLTLHVRRGVESLNFNITPRVNPPPGQGALGVSMVLTGVVSYPWYEAIWRGIYSAFILLINTAISYFTLLKTLIIERHLIGEASGPVGIAVFTGQVARVSISYLLQFVALISINLAVLNSIPFPALDGGRAIMLIIEKIKGSPIHRKTEAAINMIGFYLLVLLIVYITIKDIGRYL